MKNIAHSRAALCPKALAYWLSPLAKMAWLAQRGRCTPNTVTARKAAMVARVT
jgi:hypothetical protein